MSISQSGYMDTEHFPSRVSEIRRARNITQAELSRRAGMQLPTVNKIDLGTRNVTRNTAPVLARALQVEVPELYAEIGAPISPPTKPFQPIDRTRGGIALGDLELPAAGTLRRDLPVRGSAEGGPDGVFELLDETGLALDIIRRPPGMEGVSNAFALYTAGESMSPWREPGDLIFVHPGRPPAPGSYVVVVLHAKSRDEPRRAMVKRLVRRSPSKVIVEQFNPPKQLEFDAKEVEQIWRVIDWQEALGFG